MGQLDGSKAVPVKDERCSVIMNGQIRPGVYTDSSKAMDAIRDLRRRFPDGLFSILPYTPREW